MAEQTDRKLTAAPLKRSSIRRWRILALEEVQHQQLGQEWSPHWHDEWSVGVVLAGVCDCQVGGQPWHLPAGTILRIAPHIVHTGALLPHANSAAVHVLMWYLPAEWLQAQGFGWPNQSSFFHDPALAQQATQLNNEADLVAWLAQVVEHFACSSLIQQLVISPKASQLLLKIQQYLQHESCSVADAARFCGISREYLHRQIKRWTGMGPQHYFRVIRLNRARTLLLQGETISATSQACGFADQAHFTRWFRRAFGYSPGDLQLSLWLEHGSKPTETTHNDSL